jgi:hypothetical protein
VFNFLGPLFNLLKEIWKKIPMTTTEKRDADRYKSESDFKEFRLDLKKWLERNRTPKDLLIVLLYLCAFSGCVKTEYLPMEAGYYRSGWVQEREKYNECVQKLKTCEQLGILLQDCP